jgi:hypothetical protein
MDVAIVLLIQDIPKERWLCQKKYLNSVLIISKMEPNKIHERVLEIQSQIENVPPEKQTEMLNELLDLASQIEQSLMDIKIKIDEE